MSSTNRSKARDQHISDYYITPIDEIKTFLKHFNQEEDLFKKGPILDPCAGGDNENQMSYPAALIESGYNGKEIFTIDIREDSLAEIKEDYLDQPPGDFEIIITNPPFLIAIDVIEKALRDVKENGFVIMLLRLNFLGSKQRKAFWEEHPAKYIFVHHKRMSFRADNKTDSIEYAHFVWQKGHRPEYAKIKII
jgi:hypothetical protein